jgi:hemoglobin-like flavoprotein
MPQPVAASAKKSGAGFRLRMKQSGCGLETRVKRGLCTLGVSIQEPMMQTQEITLVRQSFQLVEPIAAQAAALFYQHLFEIDPSLRALFKGDMAQQGQSLMKMIGAAVALLDGPVALMPVLQALGRRHIRYGVQDAHYASVGAALLQTLSDGLGEQFTPPVRAAWTAMYGLVSRTMMAAAHAELLAAAAALKCADAA